MKKSPSSLGSPDRVPVEHLNQDQQHFRATTKESIAAQKKYLKACDKASVITAFLGLKATFEMCIDMEKSDQESKKNPTEFEQMLSGLPEGDIRAELLLSRKDPSEIEFEQSLVSLAKRAIPTVTNFIEIYESDKDENFSESDLDTKRKIFFDLNHQTPNSAAYYGKQLFRMMKIREEMEAVSEKYGPIAATYFQDAVEEKVAELNLKYAQAVDALKNNAGSRESVEKAERDLEVVRQKYEISKEAIANDHQEEDEDYYKEGIDNIAYTTFLQILENEKKAAEHCLQYADSQKNFITEIQDGIKDQKIYLKACDKASVGGALLIMGTTLNRVYDAREEMEEMEEKEEDEYLKLYVSSLSNLAKKAVPIIKEFTKLYELDDEIFSDESLNLKRKLLSALNPENSDSIAYCQVEFLKMEGMKEKTSVLRDPYFKYAAEEKVAELHLKYAQDVHADKSTPASLARVTKANIAFEEASKKYSDYQAPDDIDSSDDDSSAGEVNFQKSEILKLAFAQIVTMEIKATEEYIKYANSQTEALEKLGTEISLNEEQQRFIDDVKEEVEAKKIFLKICGKVCARGVSSGMDMFGDMMKGLDMDNQDFLDEEPEEGEDIDQKFVLNLLRKIMPALGRLLKLYAEDQEENFSENALETKRQILSASNRQDPDSAAYCSVEFARIKKIEEESAKVGRAFGPIAETYFRDALEERMAKMRLQYAQDINADSNNVTSNAMVEEAQLTLEKASQKVNNSKAAIENDPKTKKQYFGYRIEQIDVHLCQVFVEILEEEKKSAKDYVKYADAQIEELEKLEKGVSRNPRKWNYNSFWQKEWKSKKDILGEEVKVEIKQDPPTYVGATLVLPLMTDKESVWYKSAEVNGGDLEGMSTDNRANKFKVVGEVYQDSRGNLNQEKIQNTFLNILRKISVSDDSSSSIPIEQVIAIIDKAKERGGVSNKAKGLTGGYETKTSRNEVEDIEYLDKDGEVKRISASQAKRFSKAFQRECESCGIYSGREGGKGVGLRLTFVPDNVVAELKEMKSKKDIGGFDKFAESYQAAIRKIEEIKQDETLMIIAGEKSSGKSRSG